MQHRLLDTVLTVLAYGLGAVFIVTVLVFLVLCVAVELGCRPKDRPADEEDDRG